MEEGGSIISTTSVTVELSAVGLSGYVGTKAATDKVIQVAAKEYQHKRLKINSLSPEKWNKRDSSRRNHGRVTNFIP